MDQPQLSAEDLRKISFAPNDLYRETGRFRSGPQDFRCNLLAKRGDSVPIHHHYRPHNTMLWRGAAVFELWNPDGTYERIAYRAPAVILIREKVDHRITALQADTLLFCVLSHWQPGTDEPSQEYTGWEADYV